MAISKIFAVVVGSSLTTGINAQAKDFHATDDLQFSPQVDMYLTKLAASLNPELILLAADDDDYAEMTVEGSGGDKFGEDSYAEITPTFGEVNPPPLPSGDDE